MFNRIAPEGEWGIRITEYGAEPYITGAVICVRADYFLRITVFSR